MDKTIRVTILGREYPLRVSEAHEAFTRRVAELVDERIQAVEQQAPGHPDLTHAIIAAMSLAEELLTAQEHGGPAAGENGAAPGAGGAVEALQALEGQADALADRLEAALQNEAGAGPNPEGVSVVPAPPPTGGGA